MVVAPTTCPILEAYVKSLTLRLLVNVWNGDKRLNEIVLAASDIISFHNYGNKEQLEYEIAKLKKHNRPLINTEWMNRPNESTIATNLEVFYKEKVG